VKGRPLTTFALGGGGGVRGYLCANVCIRKPYGSPNIGCCGDIRAVSLDKACCRKGRSSASRRLCAQVWSGRPDTPAIEPTPQRGGLACQTRIIAYDFREAEEPEVSEYM
ncbi:MAG: hypothetical protein RDU59_12780, partial [Thermodesulfobacteriota bacterium]|nr:hypothetical protein [Thermodesulfobacteriota bacterium]